MQQGQFTLHMPDNFLPNTAVDRRPLDKIIEAVRINNKLFRFTLPAYQAPKLLRFLSWEGVKERVSSLDTEVPQKQQRKGNSGIGT